MYETRSSPEKLSVSRCIAMWCALCDHCTCWHLRITISTTSSASPCTVQSPTASNFLGQHSLNPLPCKMCSSNNNNKKNRLNVKQCSTWTRKCDMRNRCDHLYNEIIPKISELSIKAANYEVIFEESIPIWGLPLCERLYRLLSAIPQS